MKKISLFMSGMLLSIIGLTSCLQNTGNTETGRLFGVLTLSSAGMNFVLNTAIGAVFDPQITQWVATGQMQQNGCYLFDYMIDYGLPDNSSASLQANGYYTITITDYLELPGYTPSSNLTDTTTVLPNEVPVVNGCSAWTSIGQYFIAQQVVNQPADRQLNWNMSYDYNTLTNPAEESGLRYYDVFVRAIKMTDGMQSVTDVTYLNAYNMSNFLQLAATNEKTQLGGSYSSTSSIFRLRVNYARTITDSVITWQNSIQEVPIYPFITE